MSNCKLPALRNTFIRQTHIGHLAILFLAFWVFGQYGIDKWRGEPFISVVLAQEYDENHTVVIREDINVKYPNRGLRNNLAYDNQGRILCLKNIVSYWNKSRQRIWYLDAFLDCPEPRVPYQVCTVFSVYSKGGIEKKFGANKEFCTAIIQPVNGITNDANHGKPL